MKKFLLVLFLCAGATTFANTGKVSLKKATKKTTKKVVLRQHYSMECDGITYGWYSDSHAGAAAVGNRLCGGGVICIC